MNDESVYLTTLYVIIYFLCFTSWFYGVSSVIINYWLSINFSHCMQVFGTIYLKPDTAINRHNNFRTFTNGLMLLFR